MIADQDAVDDIGHPKGDREQAADTRFVALPLTRS
jgi:hypothetical protein